MSRHHAETSDAGKTLVIVLLFWTAFFLFVGAVP